MRRTVPFRSPPGRRWALLATAADNLRKTSPAALFDDRHTGDPGTGAFQAPRVELGPAPRSRLAGGPIFTGFFVLVGGAATPECRAIGRGAPRLIMYSDSEPAKQASGVDRSSEANSFGEQPREVLSDRQPTLRPAGPKARGRSGPVWPRKDGGRRSILPAPRNRRRATCGGPEPKRRHSRRCVRLPGGRSDPRTTQRPPARSRGGVFRRRT